MDDKDIEILKHLSVDGRQSARQLSHRLGVSTVTVLSRIKKLEEQNIIQGYSVRLNHELLGYEITAIIEIKSNKGKMLEIESEIAKSLTSVQDKNKDVEIGSYHFFQAGKLGVSIVIRSENQLKIDKCSSEILEFVNEKKIEIVVR